MIAVSQPGTARQQFGLNEFLSVAYIQLKKNVSQYWKYVDGLSASQSLPNDSRYWAGMHHDYYYLLLEWINAIMHKHRKYSKIEMSKQMKQRVKWKIADSNWILSMQNRMRMNE